MNRDALFRYLRGAQAPGEGFQRAGELSLMERTGIGALRIYALRTWQPFEGVEGMKAHVGERSGHKLVRVDEGVAFSNAEFAVVASNLGELKILGNFL